ncbi:MAG: NADH:ubiquinone oxidoreductase subunit NDUFA12 [Rhodospirillales bacterium]|nr:NADH:ubiquinone oxidoreductase subunit NDUFA12 [Rhodospirillales bacterium]MCB9964638.1 NADH:ubiquinone oxidoreductase subunit NDUFA12 [Rhodospirillales bacterium]MCB9979928.1 NADH:ubiquinone oxidoreductase subunit NDUFA12 [Rhodospirillales bacterium]
MVKKLFSLLGVLSPLHIRMVTLFSGSQKVGQDPFGNVYYKAKPRPGYKRERRWVLYKGVPEASAVPPEWHGWLHHQTDVFPHPDTPSFRRPWQKPHRPNMTGTTQAYRPPGHLLQGGHRASATGDYEAWSPDASQKKPVTKPKK